MDIRVHQFDGTTTLEALPLAAGLLVATARRDPRLAGRATFTIRTARVDPGLAADGGPADVLAFSSYVWNERYSLEVARRARARRPDSFVVFGGPSVPRRRDEAAAFLRAHPFVDALAFGEGELTFRDLVCALDAATPLEAVAGLALRARSRPEGAMFTAPRGRLAAGEFGATASPYLDGTFDALAAGRPVGAAIIETNRGCPFACTFCDWGQAVASPVHELPLERLHGELAWIGERRVPYVYIVDANYGMRRRDVEIVREIGRVKARTGFPQYVFFHLTKNATERHLDVVFALKEAGIATHLALSAQDFDPRVLEAVKRENIRLDRALALRRICHERGIPTFNELILGLPEQSYASFADSLVKAVTPYPGDVFNLYLARVLPNAELAAPEERRRHGVTTRHVGIASFHRASGAGHVPEVEEVVVATHALPIADWRRAFRFGFFLAAAHNLRLLDFVLQIAWRSVGLDLRRLVEDLLDRGAGAAPGSALGRVHEVLERHADAILAGDAMVLPAADTGDHLWAVEDAVLGAALAGGFHDEVEAALADRGGPLVAEAVRFQRFITPAPGSSATREAVFRHDFPAWREGPVVERATSLRFVPARSLAVAADRRAFLLAYLGLVHARIPLGTIGPIPG